MFRSLRLMHSVAAGQFLLIAQVTLIVLTVAAKIVVDIGRSVWWAVIVRDTSVHGKAVVKQKHSSTHCIKMHVSMKFT